jgi:hypothetical protein
MLFREAGADCCAIAREFRRYRHALLAHRTDAAAPPAVS